MSGLVLIAGVTGYVGSRLLPLLARQDYRVRCLECWPENLRGRVPAAVEIVHGDMQHAASLAAALAGVEVAFYLVHAQSAAGEDADADLHAARLFGAAARSAGVRRIVYFGGLGTQRSDRAHRRRDVSGALGTARVPVIELRASVIIGAGSLGFDLLRTLVERLPVIIAPRWMRVPLHPIHIDDVVACMLEAADLRVAVPSHAVICGPDAVSYADLMREYARQRGLRRWFIPVPVDAARLSRLGLVAVAPGFARIGASVIDSARGSREVANDEPAFAVRPLGVSQALARVIQSEDAELSGKRWSQALSAEDAVRHWGGARFRNRYVDSRVVKVAGSAAAAFAAVEGIGGRNGWYSAPWLWELRGWMDRLVGGVGMGRGRPDPEHLAVGDVLDCWRVVALEHGRRLLLAAEMKLPGRGWLEFEVQSAADGRSATLRQTASFDPLGFTGLLYWYLSWPLHQLVFVQMVRGLAQQAESLTVAAAPTPPAAGAGVSSRR